MPETTATKRRSSSAAKVYLSKEFQLWLLGAFLIVGASEGYVANAPPFTKPSVLPKFNDYIVLPNYDFLLDESIEATKSPISRRSQKDMVQNAPKKVTYNLGIGKNLPVSELSDYASPTPRNSHNVYEATKYLNEHEVVRKYPSPLVNNRQPDYETPKPQHQPTKRRRSFLPTQPTRQATQELTIFDSGDNEIFLSEEHKDMPVVIPASAKQLDVNTVWVEMLIHTEQQKHNSKTLH